MDDFEDLIVSSSVTISSTLPKVSPYQWASGSRVSKL